MIWDRALGYSYIALDTLQYQNHPPGAPAWHSVDQEVILHEGEVFGTRDATPHQILLDVRLERALVSDNLTPDDLQRKLEILNEGQLSRQQQFMGNCKKLQITPKLISLK